MSRACVAFLLAVIVQGSADFRWPHNPIPINPETVIRGVESFERFLDKSQLEQRNFKWPELSYYGGRDGRPLYIVLDDNVYDVTEFVNFHPGGDHYLRNNAGKNVTRLMRAARMPEYVFTDVLNRFKVGKIMSAVQKYTIADVASRNGRGGAPVWLIYKDSVYDVTSYIPEHPGGDVILEEAGKDSTKAFDEVDHSSDAVTVLKKYKIGEIVEEEKKYDANGKKKKRVVAAAPENNGNRSCMNKITCGLLG